MFFIIFFYKENANERNESLLSNCRAQLFLLQRYAFLLKDARNYWKIFEAEEDKQKKVYPACPMYGASGDTPYLITLSRKPLTPLNFLHFTIFPLYNVKKTKEKALKSITYLYFYYFWTNVSTKSVCLHDSNAY